MCVCVCVDDEPDDGPQHYILVVGFHQAQLPAVLGAMGVHVANVIRLSSGKTHSPDPGSGSPLLDEGKTRLGRPDRRRLCD